MKFIVIYYFLWSIIFWNFPGAISAQNITLEGRQFYDQQGNPFYPKVMNYSIEIVSPPPGGTTWNPDCYLASFIEYGNNGGGNLGIYEWTNATTTTCENQIQQDLNYIADMGFNTIRVAGFAPDYDDDSQQLYWRGRENPAGGFFQIPLHPTVAGDPGMAKVLSFYAKILALAKNTKHPVTLNPQPLNIIFYFAQNYHDYGYVEQGELNSYLVALTTYINGTLDKDALLAYDLMNEPCYCVTPRKTKTDACSMINAWYNIIQANDPGHLVTIGSCGFSDVFSFDPSIIKVDFLSVHDYPNWNKDYEDRSLPYYQNLAQERIYNQWYWMTNNAATPWIVGELGYLAATANDATYMADNLDGTTTYQTQFADNMLNSICNCGGSGYSWWAYQDGFYFSPTTVGHQYYGVLERNYVPSPAAEKPVVNSVFRFYNCTPSGPCPVSYSTIYDETKTYYNPYQHPYPNANTITGTITDQDGNPVKDAVIGGHTYLGKKIGSSDDYYFYHYTFSDENGNFEIIPHTYSPYSGGGNMASLDISAAGGERRRYSSNLNWCHWNGISYDCDPMPAGNTFALTLNRINFGYDGEVSNIVVPGPDTRNFKGYKTLTTTNLTIESGATSDISARNEVNLNSEFDAINGSEVHIYCSETFTDCSDYSSYIMQYKSGNNHTENTENKSEIELTFKKTITENNLIVIPNPSTGQFNIRLSDSEIPTYIEVSNVLGAKIISEKNNSASININMSRQPKGVYLLKVRTINNHYIKNLIIQ